MKTTLCSFLGILALCANASTTITDVKAHPRWPFASGVDITYTTAGDRLSVVNVSVSWDGHDACMPLDALSGDLFNVEAGAHKIFLDTEKLGVSGQTLKNLCVDVTEPGAVQDYLILNLLTGDFTFTNAAPSASGWVNASTAYATTNMVFRRCPKGTFTMGASDAMIRRMGGDPGKNAHWRARQVTLSDDYYIGVDLLTKGHLASITQRAAGTAPQDVAYPSDAAGYTAISYNEVRGDCSCDPRVNWPSSKYAVGPTSTLARVRSVGGAKLPSGWTIDLPTAAQWERACKATTPDEQYWSVGGTVSSTGTELTNFVQQVAATKIGLGSNPTLNLETRKPNGWGLYDMIGLRAEFVLDQAMSGAQTETTDPIGATSTGWNPNRCYNWARGDNSNILDANRWAWGGGGSGSTWMSFRLCIHTRDVFDK